MKNVGRLQKASLFALASAVFFGFFIFIVLNKVVNSFLAEKMTSGVSFLVAWMGGAVLFFFCRFLLVLAEHHAVEMREPKPLCEHVKKEG